MESSRPQKILNCEKVNTNVYYGKQKNNRGICNIHIFVNNINLSINQGINGVCFSREITVFFLSDYGGFSQIPPDIMLSSGHFLSYFCLS